MAKIQDIVNVATQGSVGGFWDVITGQAALRDLRKQYAKSLSFVDPNVGIPDQIEDAYNRALKRGGAKLWQGALKVAVGGFGKGVLVMAGVVLLGFALAFGFGAAGGAIPISAPLLVTTNATVGQGIGLGIAQAANFMTAHIAGPIVLAIGGVLGAVMDVRKHHNKLSADVARMEAENYARQREANLVREVQMLRGTPAAQFANERRVADTPLVPAPGSRESFAARETLRREAEATNPYRGL